MLTRYIERGDTSAMLTRYIERSDTSAMLTRYIERGDTATMLAYYPSTGGFGIIKTSKTIRVDTLKLATKYYASSLLSGVGANQIAYGSPLSGNVNFTYLSGKFTLGVPSGKNPPIDLLVPAGGTGIANESFGLRIRESITDGNSRYMTFGLNNTGRGGFNQGYGYIQHGYWGGGNDNVIILQPNSGRVMIGNAASRAQWQLTIKDQAAVTATTTGSNGALGASYVFGLGGSYTSNPAGIYSIYDKTLFSQGLGLVFRTDASADISNSTGVERMRISSDGQVSIGGSAPATSSIFDVLSTTKGSRPFPIMTGVQADAITGVQALFQYENGIGLRGYNGTRKFYYPESTIATGINTYIPYFDINGQITQNILFRLSNDSRPILQIGTTTSTSTSTPSQINMGSTYSSTAGANPKITLYPNYGFGVSAGSLDYMTDGSVHSFYTGATKVFTVGSAGINMQSLKTLNFSDIAPSPTTPQVNLYGSQYGFGVTASTLNYIVTSTAAHDFYTGPTISMKIAPNTGNILVGTITDIPSSILTANSTTKGILPPRWTNVQRMAISSAATALFGYQIDATEGLYIKKSTGWERLLFASESTVPTQILHEQYNTVTSTTSPVTLSNTQSDNLINQGSTQASFTLLFPATPSDGQVLSITYNNAITSLTLDGNGNTIVGSAVTTAVPGSQRKFKFYAGIGWIKIY